MKHDGAEGEVRELPSEERTKERPSSSIQEPTYAPVNVTKSDLSAEESEPEKKKRRRRKKGKMKFILPVLLLLGIGGFFAKDRFIPKEPELPTVSIAKVEIRDIEDTVVIEGPVEGSEAAEVTSQINSEIIQINVKEGDYVKKGQVLAVLNGKDMNNEIKQAQERLELSKLTMSESVEKEQQAYDSAVLAKDDVKRKMEQNKALFEAGAIAEEEYLMSKEEFEKASNTVKNFNAVNGKIVASRAQQKSIEVESNAIALKRQELDKLIIKSPINGTITRVNARLGRYANDTENKAAMFVIEDLKNLKMKVRVAENQIGKIRLGQTVSITANIIGEEVLSGVVESIAPSGEDKDGSGTQKVIPITIKILTKSERMIPGVNAKAKIMIESRKGVVSIPSEAIQSDFESNNKVVYKVMEDGTLKKQVVKTGLEDIFYSEVTEGELKVGDRLVRNSEAALEEGMKVKSEEDGSQLGENTEKAEVKEGESDAK